MSIPGGFSPLGKGNESYKVRQDAAIAILHSLKPNQLSYTTQEVTCTSASFSIDWGDGSVEQFTSNGAKTHTFARSGTYLVQYIFPSNDVTKFANVHSSWKSYLFNFEVLKLESTTLTSLYRAFYYCYGMLKVPDFTHLPNLTDFTNTVEGAVTCSADLPDRLDLSKCKVNTASGFMATTRIKKWPSMAQVKDVTNFSWGFSNCGVASGVLDMSPCTKVSNMQMMFYNCEGMTEPPVMPHSDALVNLYDTFRICLDMKHPPDLSVCPNLGDITSAFCNCRSMDRFPDFTKLTKLWRVTWAFEYCISVKDPPDFSKCTNMQRMENAFNNCWSLEAPPDLTSLTKLTTVAGMLAYCKGLKPAATRLLADQAWRNTDKSVWPSLTSTSGAVTGCSAEIRAMFPTSWGGTATERPANL